MRGASGFSAASFESKSKVTRPEIPKAVVWYNEGKVMEDQRRISRGVRALRVVFRCLRWDFVRVMGGRVEVEEEAEA